MRAAKRHLFSDIFILRRAIKKNPRISANQYPFQRLHQLIRKTQDRADKPVQAATSAGDDMVMQVHQLQKRLKEALEVGEKKTASSATPERSRWIGGQSQSNN